MVAWYMLFLKSVRYASHLQNEYINFTNLQNPVKYVVLMFFVWAECQNYNHKADFFFCFYDTNTVALFYPTYFEPSTLKLTAEQHNCHRKLISSDINKPGFHRKLSNWTWRFGVSGDILLANRCVSSDLIYWKAYSLCLTFQILCLTQTTKAIA